VGFPLAAARGTAAIERNPRIYQRGSIALDSQIGGAGGHAGAALEVVGSKGKSDRGSEALIGDMFEGATHGEAQGGGGSRSQGRDAEGCQHLAADTSPTYL
jgi:hypothetical protein